MKTNNILMGILIVIVFGVGFMIGRFSSVGTSFVGGGPSSRDTIEANRNADENSAQDATTVTAAQLTDGQRKMLSAMGIDPNSITITQEMIVCAETSLGPARVEEIKNGATPSFGEGVKLAACYKQ